MLIILRIFYKDSQPVKVFWLLFSDKPTKNSRGRFICLFCYSQASL